MSAVGMVFPPLTLHGATAPSNPGPSRYQGLPITFRHITMGRTPLDA